MICKYQQTGGEGWEGEPGEEGEGGGEGRGRITINSSLPALQLYSPVYIYRTNRSTGFSFFQFCFVAEKDVCEV
jgi:hypothetical protein